MSHPDLPGIVNLCSTWHQFWHIMERRHLWGDNIWAAILSATSFWNVKVIGTRPNLHALLLKRKRLILKNFWAKHVKEISIGILSLDHQQMFLTLIVSTHHPMFCMYIYLKLLHSYTKTKRRLAFLCNGGKTQTVLITTM